MSSLTITLTHAIAFLTRPLVGRYSSDSIERLHRTLEYNLTDTFKHTWVESEPTKGSGFRCLTLSPSKLPPSPIWKACLAAGVRWSEWIAVLGGEEFDLFVDPGCVSFRAGYWGFGQVGSLFIIWSAEAPRSKTTLAQTIVDEDEDSIFSMIADEVTAPTWMTPILDQFPAVPSQPTPVSAISRSSSRSSMGSTFSFESAGTLSSATSFPSETYEASDCGSTPTKSASSRSRRERPRVFVDASKKEVTPYDGGKTTVLTGGVMLGAPAKKSTPKRSRQSTPTRY